MGAFFASLSDVQREWDCHWVKYYLADWVGLIQSIQPEEADDPDLKKASYYLHTIATIPSEQGKRLGRDLIS